MDLAEFRKDVGPGSGVLFPTNNDGIDILFVLPDGKVLGVDTKFSAEGASTSLTSADVDKIISNTKSTYFGGDAQSQILPDAERSPLGYAVEEKNFCLVIAAYRDLPAGVDDFIRTALSKHKADFSVAVADRDGMDEFFGETFSELALMKLQWLRKKDSSRADESEAKVAEDESTREEDDTDDDTEAEAKEES